MRKVALSPPAKVNLFLRVLAREESGFHQLETLFQAIDLRDRIDLQPGGEGIRLEVAGADLGPEEENLVWRAASAFLHSAGIETGFRIRLEKKIPVGAGLGGGSSDAASTLLGLNRMHGDPLPDEELLRLAGELGSDVPFFLSPSPLSLGWGRGGRLLPLSPLSPAWLVLALPPVRVDTGAAYGALAARPPADSPVGILPFNFPRGWDEIAGLAHNAFEAVAFEQHPLLREIKGALESTEPRLAALSGSGASLFAVYSSEQRAVAASTSLAADFPEVRFETVRTLSIVERP